MIPRAHIAAWRAARAPWQDDGMVEQDLVLSRAIVDLFSDPELAALLRFRGGTCLYKLFVDHPVRYSEDLDLVQSQPGPVGPALSLIRKRLAWLGKPRSNTGRHSSSLVFSFETEVPPVMNQKVKIEINTREQFVLFEPAVTPFRVDSPWFAGAADVPTSPRSSSQSFAWSFQNGIFRYTRPDSTSSGSMYSCPDRGVPRERRDEHDSPEQARVFGEAWRQGRRKERHIGVAVLVSKAWRRTADVRRYTLCRHHQPLAAGEVVAGGRKVGK